MSLRTAALAALTLVVVAAPAQAATTRIDVPTVAANVVQKINASSTIPVYLPNAIVINGGGRKAFASGSAFQRGWAIDFGYVRNCNGANACAMASFFAERGGTLGGSANVTLANGRKAHFKPLSCGGSCSPPTLTFIVGRAAYTFSVKDPANRPKAALVNMANAAIRAGART